MRHPVRTLILVIVALLFAVVAITPPKEKLRLGKDLRGGVSLIYSVLIAPGDNAREVMSKLVEVLKKRVDPNAQLDISFVPQGRDRLEITMPLPNEEIKKLRGAFETELEALARSSITESQLELLMRSDPVQREAEILRIAGSNTARADQLRAAAAAQDAARSARANLEKAGDVSEEERARLIQAAGDAELAYDKARSVALAASISAEEVRQVLQLSGKETKKTDTSGGKHQQVVIPSPRARALQRLRDQHPESVAQIDRVLAAWDKYEKNRKTLDDPEDLIRLLRGAGVLDFRITVDPGKHPDEARLRQELHERGPKNVKATDVGWYKINKIDAWFDSKQEGDALLENPAAYFRARQYVVEEYDGQYYLLAYDSPGNRLTRAEGEWKVARASRGQDQLGRPAIAYEMDARGATLQGQLTGDHIRDRMAVLLDDQVVTAPVLQDRISKNGQISGGSAGFSEEELEYIIQTLNAGSLQAKLSPEPINRNVVGPELGADNLRQGLAAGVWCLVFISVFMVVYYYPTCGGIAVVSLLCNGILLLGIMAGLLHAAFTLPGMAGIVLTFGQAVDSNVLIYERMREEIRQGFDLRTAAKLGHDKAMSSIMDGNITHLIVCIVLAYTGTAEIRGFGVTLGVGIITTLFCALVISKMILFLLIDFAGLKKVRMLPLDFPWLQKALTPHIDWLGLRFIFIVISTVYVGLGLAMVFARGEQMLDLEFRGGTQVTLVFKETAGEHHLTMTRKEVQDRITAIAQGVPQTSPLVEFRNAEVLPQNPEADGVTSDTFTIRTLLTDQDLVVKEIAAAFAGELGTQPAIRAVAIDETDYRKAPVYAVVDPRLGPNIDRPQYLDGVKDYLGGVVIVLEEMTPPPTRAQLVMRLQQMREQQMYSDTLARKREVRILEGDDSAVRSAAILVRDDNVGFFGNQDAWKIELAQREWSLTRDALLKPATLAGVQNFSPAIASTFKAQAVVALSLSFLLIGIYIWVRFGSVRYSLGAIACLFHDVLTAIGLIALAQILYNYPPTQGICQKLGILPFKIDLNMIAALMTIAGYSLNDTIIIMDRIRENRGKASYASRETINNAINQTISRTLITSGTTLVSLVVLYIWGGEGVRGFSFAMIIGIVVGTYSSWAVAAPLVWSRRHHELLTKSAEGGAAGA